MNSIEGLVGKWEAGGEIIEFFENGTIHWGEEGSKWKIENNRLCFFSKVWDYKISDSTLSLINDGQELILRKKSSR